ncbi:unnamed protein product [Strongylus vulgaris]|uniref:SLC26A/SulP transporter domain-containing protein n=1 Tax=Strongylus vulgaris TaxID=40348 RepID=A0A3P7IW45_STRVU|nr:unnamed protein product [Strongylus vulgaris]
MLFSTASHDKAPLSDIISNNHIAPAFVKIQIKVVFSILLVYLSEDTRYQINVPIVGKVGCCTISSSKCFKICLKVDSGFPSPRVPPFEQVGELLWQGVTVAIISFVIHIALAKLVSKKFNYEIDVNQSTIKEWFALGAGHTISSFFGCFVGGSSIGRTMMQVKLGTRSQVRASGNLIKGALDNELFVQL